MTARIAYIDPRRHLSVLEADGTHRPQTLGEDQTVLWGPWSPRSVEASAWSWPTWSPDGRQIACFRVGQSTAGAYGWDVGSDSDTATGERTARVAVVDLGGVSSSELIELGTRLPIYLHWSPDARRIAVLSQKDELLQLSVAWPNEIGRETLLAEGSPLFFTWAGSERLAAFVGSGAYRDGEPFAGGRLALFGPNNARHVVLPGLPGNFCAPIWLGDRVLYVAHHAGRTALVEGREGSPELKLLEDVDGLVALIATPDARTIARAIAPGGDGTPYRHIGLVDIESGEVVPLVDQPCLAFVWSPTGKHLVIARVDTDRNLLEWSLVDRDGRIEHLVDMHPTRDLGFYLRFFEQYAQSHPIVDPTGEYLLLAGGIADSDEPPGLPRLWRVSLTDGGIDEVGEGVFGVYAPR